MLSLPPYNKLTLLLALFCAFSFYGFEQENEQELEQELERELEHEIELPQLVAPPPAVGTLKAEISRITSESVSIKWQRISGQSKTIISIAPEPAAKPTGQSVLSKNAATLLGARTSFTLHGLAADTHVFINIEVWGKKARHITNLHAKTVGGATAKLNTPLREAHMLAPDILMLVMAKGNGAALQQARWNIKRSDGRAIAVKKINRRSLPVSAPHYFIGTHKPNSNDIIETDHQLFLFLDQHVGRQEILSISGPPGIKFTLPFSDKYLETPVIQLNQVGYNPWAGKRYAYVYFYLGDGGALDLGRVPVKVDILKESILDPTSRHISFSGLKVRPRSRYDDDSGGEVREIKLGILPPSNDSRYRIQIPGVGVSYPTMVSDLAVFKSFYVAARGLYHNRWGVELDKKHTDWPRPADHPYVWTAEQTDFTRMYSENTPKQGKRKLSGGYHDAADFDQRPSHTVVPMLLMSLYELQPRRFSDSQLTLPESKNGIPDLLDEALWGIRAWEQLQEADGGVRMGVESYRHPTGYYFANEDSLPYWTYARHPNITARAAGLFAQASRLLKRFDVERSKELKSKAFKAYKYAKSKAAAAAYMLYASGELLLLTGRNEYKRDFEKAWQEMGPYGSFSKMGIHHPGLSAYRSSLESRQQAFAMFDYLMGYYKSPHASPDLKGKIRQWTLDYASKIAEGTFASHAHRNPRPAGTPMGWGQGSTMGRYLDPVIAALRMGGLPVKLKQDLLDTLSLSADYSLGCNPNGMVYYTGLGSKNVRESLHLDSLVWIKKGKKPVPGIPAFGPVDGAPGSAWTQTAIKSFYPAMNDWPHALRYADLRVMVVCNESTVWENYAPNIKLFGAILRPNVMPPDSWLPGKKDHDNPLP